MFANQIGLLYTGDAPEEPRKARKRKAQAPPTRSVPFGHWHRVPAKGDRYKFFELSKVTMA